MEVIKKIPKIDLDSLEGEILENVSRNVEFHGVKFSYLSWSENPILRNFNLKVLVRRMVALVGNNASRKSIVMVAREVL